MSKKNNNSKYVGIGLIATLIILFLAFSQSFSVISTSEVKWGSDGKPVWVFYLAPEGNGENIEFYSPTTEQMPKYTDEKGGEYIAQYDFSIEFDPEDVTCTYTLNEDTKLSDKIVSFFAKLFGGEATKYYDVSESFERSAPILVTTSKNPTGKVIDGFAARTSISFTDERDARGNIYIQSQGGLMGKVDCVSTGGTLKVAQGQNTGKLQYYFDEDVSGYRVVRDSWQTIYEKCEISSDKTKMICTHGTKGIPGVGTLTVTADANYLDYRYFPPTVGKPKIVSITAQNEITTNTYGSVLVTIKNVGDNSGLFSLEGTGITVSPSITTVNLEADEQKDIYFNIVAPAVKEEKKYTGNFEMCTTSQYSSSSCNDKDYTITVIPGEAEESCGDGLCQISESFNTCPADCKQVLVCEGNFMFVEDGTCKCEAGYSMQKDVLGRQFCEKNQYTELLIIGAFIVIILVMVLIRMRMKGGRR